MNIAISPSKLPGTTAVAMIVNFKLLKVFETKIFLGVMGLLAIELVILIEIVRRVLITARILREAPYVKHLGKQSMLFNFVFDRCPVC